MTPLTLNLNYVAPVDLLEATARGQPRTILLLINWQEQTISAETKDPEDNTQPETRWHGLEDAYSLPPLTDATQLRQWVEDEVLPRAAPLAEAYQTIWEDVKCFGRFPGHEREKEDFDAWMDRAEPPTHAGRLWSVEDWLAGGVPEIRAETPDDNSLLRIACDIHHEAEQANVVLIGGGPAVIRHLQNLRDGLREAPDTPDRYEIEGYEVLERVPRLYQGHSSCTLNLPPEYANKRVKVVRIDP